MTAFSWIKTIEYARATKVRRAKRMVVSDNVGTITDLMIQHPQWVKDAQQKKFTELELITKQKFDKQQDHKKVRLEKLRPKKIRF